MAANFKDDKLIIQLSNTESVSSNILKFINLRKEGEIKASSTAGYFLTTETNLSNQIKAFLSCDTDEFMVDVAKTKEYIEQMDEVIKMLSLLDFHNQLKEYFEQRGHYFITTQNFSIGKPECSVDGGNRLNIKFNNKDKNVKKFRGIVIAILCDLVIEKSNNTNIIYPILKNDIINKIKREYKKIDDVAERDENEMKEKFKQWLLKKNINESSVEAYINQIDIMSKEAQEDNLINKSIYEIKRKDELNLIVPLITNSEKFIQRKEKQDFINSAALNHYIDFLKTYYDSELFLEEVFIDNPKEYKKLCTLLSRKKNIILTGSPGVGKTFMAQRLAYSIIGEKAKDQILSVQFHQAFSYEDFIEGIRPKKNEEEKFIVTPGMFKTFIKTALDNHEKKYFVIIDEINRGNPSKIFGELLKLIEKDKRYIHGSETYEYVILPYSREEFKIPENIYIIGTMNTADRSLAMVDYALRRRFAFYPVRPKFSTKKFSEWLRDKNRIHEQDINTIITRMNTVNENICSDLKEDFEIGHSYFVDNINPNDFEENYNEIIEYEILPLIQEYFIDDKTIIEKYEKILQPGNSNE